MELVVLEVHFVPAHSCCTRDGEDDFECTIYSGECHTKGTRRDNGHMYEGLCEMGRRFFDIPHFDHIALFIVAPPLIMVTTAAF